MNMSRDKIAKLPQNGTVCVNCCISHTCFAKALQKVLVTEAGFVQCFNTEIIQYHHCLF